MATAAPWITPRTFGTFHMETLLKPGMIIEFFYPAANYRCVRYPKLERRRLRVVNVRSLACQPLNEVTLTLEPDRCRGQTLVTGLDLDKGQERSFYAESMREVRPFVPGESELAMLRIAMIENGTLKRWYEIADPRAAFCRNYNALQTGETAVAF